MYGRSVDDALPERRVLERCQHDRRRPRRAVTVPLAAELAFRGFLPRRLIQPDFENLPVGIFTWSSFLISSALFGAFHGGLWVAGTIAGMSFALALYRRGALGDAVQAHATTNGLIAVYAFATGRWSVWS